MVDQVVNYYFGYAQIHSNGYWKEKTLDKSFIYDDQLKALITEENGIADLVPRIESFALASYGEGSKGTLMIGVDPEKEAGLTHLQDRVTKGSYFETSKSLLVAEGLADYLEIGVGDTLVLVSQGYHGVNAAGKYPISGLVSFGSPELNGQMVFMSLAEADEFYGTEGHITNLIVKPIDAEELPQIVRKLNKHLDKEQFEIHHWIWHFRHDAYDDQGKRIRIWHPESDRDEVSPDQYDGLARNILPWSDWLYCRNACCIAISLLPHGSSHSIHRRNGRSI